MKQWVLTRRTLIAAGIGAAALAAASWSARARVAAETLSAPALLDLTAFDTHEMDWVDTQRSRPVPVRLYWPRAAIDQPLPLVVFSHGIGGSRRGYTYLGGHFAAHGIASLHLQHVGSDRSLWLGNPFGLVGRLHGAAQDREALDRVLDLRFALDHLLVGQWGERVDRRRIVAAGHSYGANTTLLAAGARVERAGRVADLGDARIRAAILISAPPLYGIDEPAQMLRHVRVPSLHITATEDVIRIPGYYSPAADRVAVFEATGSARKALVVFDGGSHSMFTDRAATGGVQLNGQVKLATQELMLAFLASAFDRRDDPLVRWIDRHRAIVARYVMPA